MKVMHSGQKTQIIHEGRFMAEVRVNYQYLGTDWGHAVGPDDLEKLERVRAALKHGDIAAAAKEAQVFELHPVAAE